MKNNCIDPKKNKNNFADITIQYSISSADLAVFQIFFLANDQTDNVELLETSSIDFEEILHRLKKGESIFIKNKEQDILEPHYETH